MLTAKECVWLTAIAFAHAHFQRSHGGNARPGDAERWAAGHGHEFINRALDFLALQQAAREANALSQVFRN